MVSEVSGSSCGRKRNYTVAFKLKVVNYAEKHSKTDTSQVFCIDTKRVQKWCKQKEDPAMIGKNSKIVKRSAEGGRRPLSVSNQKLACGQSTCRLLMCLETSLLRLTTSRDTTSEYTCTCAYTLI